MSDKINPVARVSIESESLADLYCVAAGDPMWVGNDVECDVRLDSGIANVHKCKLSFDGSELGVVQYRVSSPAKGSKTDIVQLSLEPGDVCRLGSGVVMKFEGVIDRPSSGVGDRSSSAGARKAAAKGDRGRSESVKDGPSNHEDSGPTSGSRLGRGGVRRTSQQTRQGGTQKSASSGVELSKSVSQANRAAPTSRSSSSPKVRVDQPRIHTEHFASGRKSLEGRMVGSKRVGSWKFWREDGTVERFGEYQDGQEVGTWTFMVKDAEDLKIDAATHDVGAFVWASRAPLVGGEGGDGEGWTVSGERVGFWRHWREDGTPSSEGSYEFGQRSGSWKYVRADRSTEAAGSYECGEKVGQWAYSSPSSVGIEVDFTRNRHALVEWQGRAEPSEAADVAEGWLVDGQRCGPWREWLEGGAIERAGSYERGRMRGLWRFQHVSGEDLEFEYDDGLHPVVTWHAKDGEVVDGLEAEGWLVDGSRHGVWRLKSEAGYTASGAYARGKRVGQWEIHGPGGVLREEGAYVDDCRHGAWTVNYESGARRSVGSYDGGRRQGFWEVFYRDGTWRCRGNYYHGRRHGAWEFRSPQADRDGVACIAMDNDPAVPGADQVVPKPDALTVPPHPSIAKVSGAGDHSAAGARMGGRSTKAGSRKRRGQTVARVGFGPRLGASLIDGVIVTVGVLLAVFGYAAIIDNSVDWIGLTQQQRYLLVQIRDAIPWLLSLLYYSTEIFTGASLGKVLLGLKIVGMTGERAPSGVLFQRFMLKNGMQWMWFMYLLFGNSFAYYASLVIGVIMPLGGLAVFGANKQTLHDIIAKTVVCHKRDVTASKQSRSSGRRAARG